MNTVIAVTSINEQQRVMSHLQDSLKAMYLTDTSISIVKVSMSKINVLYRVKDTNHVAASYHVIFIPVSMSLESLRGFTGANINICNVLKKLDAMKTEAIAFANNYKNTKNKSNDELIKATKRLFGKELNNA